MEGGLTCTMVTERFRGKKGMDDLFCRAQIIEPRADDGSSQFKEPVIGALRISAYYLWSFCRSRFGFVQLQDSHSSSLFTAVVSQ